MSIKVIVENSVLIAASLNFFYKELDEKIVDQHYEISISLIDFFKNHICEEYGITTHRVESSAEARLNGVIEKRVRKLKLIEEKYFRVQSAIKIEIKRNFENVKKVLIIQTVDEREVDKIKPRTLEMYTEIRKIINQEKVEMSHPIMGSYRFFRKMKFALKDTEYKEKRRYYKLREKFEQKPPDVSDCEVLAQAYYLKKFKYKNEEVYIASTDFHFSKIKGYPPNETLVPDKILEYFGIKCEWPDDILIILKKSLQK